MHWLHALCSVSEPLPMTAAGNRTGRCRRTERWKRWKRRSRGFAGRAVGTLPWSWGIRLAVRRYRLRIPYMIPSRVVLRAEQVCQQSNQDTRTREKLSVRQKGRERARACACAKGWHRVSMYYTMEFNLALDNLRSRCADSHEYKYARQRRDTAAPASCLSASCVCVPACLRACVPACLRASLPLVPVWRCCQQLKLGCYAKCGHS